MAARKPQGLDAKGEALRLVEEGLVSPQQMLENALASMSEDDAWKMLDNHELSPRFWAEDESDFIVEMGHAIGRYDHN